MPVLLSNQVTHYLMGQVTYDELQARPYLHDQRPGKIAIFHRFSPTTYHNLLLQCENPYVDSPSLMRSC